jgi:hypothetical protein
VRAMVDLPVPVQPVDAFPLPAAASALAFAAAAAAAVVGGLVSRLAAGPSHDLPKHLGARVWHAQGVSLAVIVVESCMFRVWQLC